VPTGNEQSASVPDDFGARVQDPRKKKGLSQGALADKLSVSRSLVSQWERGITAPEGDDLRRVESVPGRMPPP